ncbi:hypothetical protein KW850_25600 [Bacillus sp. sid0103]|uniref:hypothetical protein n=1 Tax=Bacillus sp. sid0103 TaxID=2856337 RepID=UPI001C49275A|nr:hypothetical protein [Bacillus sp. sid0103]MBV7508595.1 hypothetical protein [Bacillus sp. sid0103]
MTIAGKKQGRSGTFLWPLSGEEEPGYATVSGHLTALWTGALIVTLMKYGFIMVRNI